MKSSSAQRVRGRSTYPTQFDTTSIEHNIDPQDDDHDGPCIATIGLCAGHRTPVGGWAVCFHYFVSIVQQRIAQRSTNAEKED